MADDSLQARSDYWRNIFNPAPSTSSGQAATPTAGYIQNRNEDGTWPRFDPAASSGFAEGSSAQYTWMIPFGTPWLYLFSRHAEKTQQIIRETIKVLWKDAPAGIPGNDDLGAMSAWFVWAAMGMHPLTPGRAELMLASPLFPRMVIHRANGKTITINAPQASLETFYVQSLRVNGQASTRPWLPESFVVSCGTLEYVLGIAPNLLWGNKPEDAPPSFQKTTGPTTALSPPVTRQPDPRDWHDGRESRWLARRRR